MHVEIESVWTSGGWKFKVRNNPWKGPGSRETYDVDIIDPEGKKRVTIEKIGLPAGRVRGVNAEMSDDELAVRSAIGWAAINPYETEIADDGSYTPEYLDAWREVANDMPYSLDIMGEHQHAYEQGTRDLDYSVALESVDDDGED